MKESIIKNEIIQYDKIDKYYNGTTALFYCQQPQKFNFPIYDPYPIPPLITPPQRLIREAPRLPGLPTYTPKLPNSYPYIGKDW